MGKIIIGYGASQYDVLLYFTKEMAKGFEKRIAKGKMTQEDADKILAKITTGGRFK